MDRQMQAHLQEDFQHILEKGYVIQVFVKTSGNNLGTDIIGLLQQIGEATLIIETHNHLGYMIPFEEIHLVKILKR